MYKKNIVAALVAMNLAAPYVWAEELASPKIDATTMNLIEALVEQGVLTREKADELIQKAAQTTATSEVEQDAAPSQEEEEKVAPGTVRVPYVPEAVKQEIRQKVRTDLTEDVTADILAKAKQERWGIPGVVPTWIDRISIGGDIRIRAQSDSFPDGGGAYFDYQAINDAGSRNAAGVNATFNTTEDRDRARIRARLNLKAKITPGWKAAVRLATGSFTDPVSTNQTFGNYNTKYRLVVDRASLAYSSETEFFSFEAGRVKNPWFGTDLVWDSDLSFDGFVGKFKFAKTDNPLDVDENQLEPYLTMGAFPLTESNRDDDKWLLGFQAGLEKQFLSQSRLHIALAYYNYLKVAAIKNQLGDGTTYNYTAPSFMQKGNTLFDIAQPGSSSQLYGLATDYDLVNATVSYDLASFAPIHIYLTADYVKNVGYELSEDAKTFNTLLTTGYAEESDGYQFKVDVGWPDVRQRGNWRAYLAYRHLERDAVLDAFTDSDFHLGGTDSKGFILGGSYGLAENIWLDGRWISSEVINGEQFAFDSPGTFKVNTIQINLNAKF